ncbi:MAG: hypothetical protein V9F04_17310 [Dermatophilaceae bacterium]
MKHGSRVVDAGRYAASAGAVPRATPTAAPRSAPRAGPGTSSWISSRSNGRLDGQVAESAGAVRRQVAQPVGRFRVLQDVGAFARASVGGHRHDGDAGDDRSDHPQHRRPRRRRVDRDAVGSALLEGVGEGAHSGEEGGIRE